MKICLDPGHSGPIESGAGAAGYTEAVINLQIAQKTGEMLTKQGYDIIYTRVGDIEDDGLVFRAEIANNAEADIFISIHCNAAANSEARGVETYHYPAAYDGTELARCIQNKLAAVNYTHDRGVKEANFAVLRLTNMSAVLIECGFITSSHDRLTLTTDQGQRQIAAAIVSGIKTYLF